MAMLGILIDNILVQCTLCLVLVNGSSAQFDRSSTDAHSLLACGVSGTRMDNNVISSYPKQSKLQCARLCLSERTCSSFNWRISDGQCELSSSDKTTNTGGLQANTDFKYWAPDGCPFYIAPTTTTAAPTTTADPCPTPAKMVSGKCVSREASSSMNWADADSFCKTKAPAGEWTLVTFQTGKAFMDAVITQLLPTSDVDKLYWIGLNKQSGTWKWLDPGSTSLVSDKTMWYLGDDTEKGPTCGNLHHRFSMYSRTFNGLNRGESCMLKESFICMKHT